jgi:hypothetical protein
VRRGCFEMGGLNQEWRIDRQGYFVYSRRKRMEFGEGIQFPAYYPLSQGDIFCCIDIRYNDKCPS